MNESINENHAHIIEILAGHEHRIIGNQNTTDESLMMYPAYKAAYTALDIYARIEYVSVF